jgi:hypothetical protein
MGFDQFSEAWDTVRKVVMMKKGENANPAASEIQGEPLFTRNDANPYKAMGIPHDEATANINRNVLPGETVMVQNTKHDGKDQPDGKGNIDPQPVKDMDKEREKENKAASKDIPKQIHEGLMDFDQFDELKEAESAQQYSHTIEELEQDKTLVQALQDYLGGQPKEAIDALKDTNLKTKFDDLTSTFTDDELSELIANVGETNEGKKDKKKEAEEVATQIATNVLGTAVFLAEKSFADLDDEELDQKYLEAIADDENSKESEELRAEMKKRNLL